MPTAIKNIKVLIAEDNKGICDLYAMAFMHAQFKVYTANDGKTAIEKFYAKEPDLVLLDIMMPGVDGYEVLKEIRKRQDKYIPVMMLTNLDMEHFTRHDFLDRIDAYVIKSNHTPSEVIQKAKEILKINKLI